MSKLIIVLIVSIVLILVFASMGSSTPSKPVVNPNSSTVSSVPKPAAPAPAPAPTSAPVAAAIAATTNFCYRYAINPMRSMIYKSNDCNAAAPWNGGDSNVGGGGAIKGFATKQPGTEKYCYRYAQNPDRTLFYRSDDCNATNGWGANVPSFGSGGEVYLYTTEQPNSDKYCYRYASSPDRTLFYKSADCTSKWGWGSTVTDRGSGGEVWLPR